MVLCVQSSIAAQVSFGTLGSSYPVRGYTNPSRDNFANVRVRNRALPDLCAACAFVVLCAHRCAWRSQDLWPKEQDIMKFRALHCFLFPTTDYCPQR